MLAVDPGSRRVGIAVSDPTGTVAQPLTALEAEPAVSLAERLVALARKQGAERIVVGLPRRLDGSLGPEADAARHLADRLRRLSRLPVSLEDERLTSVEADRALIASGIGRVRRKHLSHPVAAALILQAHLERRRR